MINFLREYYDEYQIAPAVRVLTKAIGKKLGADKGNSKYLYELFPYGPAKQACKYRRPAEADRLRLEPRCPKTGATRSSALTHPLTRCSVLCRCRRASSCGVALQDLRSMRARRRR